MIGLVRKQGGLYTLELANFVPPKSVFDVLSKLSSFSFENLLQSCNFASVIYSTSLWHSRLGHHSFQRLAILQTLVPDVINCSNNKSFDCPICLIAKQKWLPFQSSVHVLILVLIWFMLTFGDLIPPLHWMVLNTSLLLWIL